MKKHPYYPKKFPASVNWGNVLHFLPLDYSVEPIDSPSGEKAAKNRLTSFLQKDLLLFDATRNDPFLSKTSHLSAYLHFGQISAQRVILELLQQKKGPSRESFFEEVFIRRELADNFCFYNSSYDAIEGFPTWAQKTLQAHLKDKRKVLYSQLELEKAKTNDPLWNAAQRELIKTGHMQGYLRMYWAKKILEWSPSPKEAFRRAIYLNDKYELDGRDPNGYTGIAWSLGGVHDRAWGERPVFGKIRYMSFEGIKRKCDIVKYIEKWNCPG
ncbi:MAG: hypothetical protein WCP39_00340 [Chlamydiota bacterium]